MIYLENEYIKAGFSQNGAELQSLENKHSGISYLWNGDANFWAKHSPVLFPIVGALKNNTYFYDGKSYQLSRHGLARDHQFEYSLMTDNELIFTLKSTDETMKIYPFQFELQIRYTLNHNSLSCSYEVSNPSAKELLFSIGGHPAFATPVTKEVTYSDYFIEFNSDDDLSCHKLEGDLISQDIRIINLKNKQLELSRSLFANDALVIKNLKSNVLSLKCHKSNYRLDFDFDGFPYFGIWAAKGADFVCLEPWCGIADAVDHNQHLNDKEGIVKLNNNESWARNWKATIY